MAGAVAAPTHIAADPDCSYRLAIQEGQHMKVMTMVATMVALGLVLLGSSTAAFAKKHTMHTTEARHCQIKGAEVSKS